VTPFAVHRKSHGMSACGRYCCKKFLRILASNIDSMSGAYAQRRFKIHLSRFDYCAFLFYSFVAVTEAGVQATGSIRWCEHICRKRRLYRRALPTKIASTAVFMLS
jgi:predicted lipoprotein with Yx(FWY)xxD motif